LGVHKTHTRVVVTLAGGVTEVREVEKECTRGEACPVQRSQVLVQTVKPRHRFAWDVVVHVGLARHMRGLQRSEIQAELYELHDIELSAGSVTNLCTRFLLALEALHLSRASALRAAMEHGYPLHLDATCDRGKGGLFVCMNGWRGWVLMAARIASENGDVLKPLVAKTVGSFGDPVATVRDLGDAGGKAVESLAQKGIPDLLCHYHFVAAVGKKLLDKPYSNLRNALSSLGVKTKLHALLKRLRQDHMHAKSQASPCSDQLREALPALMLWILEADGRKECRYPFGLPWRDLVHRCCSALMQAESWVPHPRTTAEKKGVENLKRIVTSVSRDPRITKAMRQLEESWTPFCELRAVMRLQGADLPRSEKPQPEQRVLSPVEHFRLKEIQTALTEYGIDLRTKVATVGKRRSGFCPQEVILDYLDRYGEKLFGHPVARDQVGSFVAVVERTNNILEQFFGQAKQRLRRRLGRAHLGRDMEQQPAQAALVHNLQHPDYVRVLCGSLDNLPAALAAVDAESPSATSIDRSHRNTQLQRCIRSLLERSPNAAPTRTQPSSSITPPQDLGTAVAPPEQTDRAKAEGVFQPKVSPSQAVVAEFTTVA